MQMSWRWTALVFLAAVWPNLGCVQLPVGKAVQETRTPKAPPVAPPQQELTTTQSLLINADALEKRGQIDDAVARYEQIRQTGGPEALVATKKLALLYYRNGDFDRAEQEYLLLTNHNKNDADAQCKLGEIYSSRGLWPSAEKYYSDAAYYDPANPVAHAGLGMALAQQGHYTQSLEAFSKIGTKADAYRSIAFVQKLQGKINDAARALQEAVKLDSSNMKAREELAQLRLVAPNAGDAEPIVNMPQPKKEDLVRVTTPQPKKEEQGNVELEDYPQIALGSQDGMSRLGVQRPTLPPLPDLDLTSESGRDWECTATKKKCKN